MHLLEEAIRAGLATGNRLLQRVGAAPRAQAAAATFRAHRSPAAARRSLRQRCADRNTARRGGFGEGEAVLCSKTHCSPPALVVIAAGLQDPGNLGTIARSAEAFGATGLLLGERTVSPWNWKALRASAGSMFRSADREGRDCKALEELKARGVRVLATSSHKGTLISQTRLVRPGGADRRQRRRRHSARNPCASRRDRSDSPVVKSRVAQRRNRSVRHPVRSRQAESQLTPPAFSCFVMFSPPRHGTHGIGM